MCRKSETEILRKYAKAIEKQNQGKRAKTCGNEFHAKCAENSERLKYKKKGHKNETEVFREYAKNYGKARSGKYVENCGKIEMQKNVQKSVNEILRKYAKKLWKRKIKKKSSRRKRM